MKLVLLLFNDVEAELDEDNEEDQEGEDMMKFANPLLD